MPVAVEWLKVADDPERWEHAAFGAIERRTASLWAILPTCGHSYAALSLVEAQAQTEQRGGRCFACWRAEPSS